MFFDVIYGYSMNAINSNEQPIVDFQWNFDELLELHDDEVDADVKRNMNIIEKIGTQFKCGIDWKGNIQYCVSARLA